MREKNKDSGHLRPYLSLADEPDPSMKSSSHDGKEETKSQEVFDFLFSEGKASNASSST